MRRIDDKKRFIITLTLAIVAGIAATVTFLFIFGVFGGESKSGDKNTDGVRVYALTKEYVVEDKLSVSEGYFSFTAETDTENGTFTVVITYFDENKVVSFKPYGVSRNNYETEVTAGGKALKLKQAIEYGEKTVTAVYALTEDAEKITIKNFIVTER